MQDLLRGTLYHTMFEKQPTLLRSTDYLKLFCFKERFLDRLLFYIMVALWYRADHYILACGFFFFYLLLLFSSPNLSRCRLDVYHTSTHGVALVRI